MTKQTTKIKYNSFIDDNIKYMQCKICGNYVTGVSDNATSVTCSNCVLGLIPFEPPKKYIPTGKPPGWQWMKEFIDKDGNVYHKGVAQPDLKDTLPPTPIKPKKKNKKTRKTKEQILIQRHKEKKIILKQDKKRKQKQIKKVLNKK